MLLVGAAAVVSRVFMTCCGSLGCGWIQTFGRNKRRELLGASDGDIDILDVVSRPRVVHAHSETLMAGACNFVTLTSPVLTCLGKDAEKIAVGAIGTDIFCGHIPVSAFPTHFYCLLSVFSNLRLQFVRTSSFQVHPIL
jgi:hypothetical protein